MKILEVYCGTKSFSKVAEDRGHNKKHCLDKERVREVIDNLNQNIQNHIDLFENNLTRIGFEEGIIKMGKNSLSYIKQLKKELGLE